MNNIHKIIWSKVRNGYVVVSELAKNHSGKGATVKTDSHTLRGGLLAAGVSAVLLFGGVQFAGASSTVDAGTTSGTNALAVGGTSKASADDAIAIGDNAVAMSSGEIAIGTGAGNAADNRTNDDNAISIGTSARSRGAGGVALGNKALSNMGKAVAIGDSATANSTDGVAIGSGTVVNTVDGVAIGSNSSVGRSTGVNNGPTWSTLGGHWPVWVEAKNSTQGTDGTWTTTFDGTSGAWTSTLGAVSIGTDGINGATYTRQLTGLAAGTYDTDAVNVAQWKSTMLATIGDTKEDSTNTRYGTDGVARNLTRLYDEYLTLTGASDTGTTLSKDELTTDANIGTIVGDNKITFRLAKNLTGLTSVTTGNTVMNSTGLTITNATDATKNITLDGTNGNAVIGGVKVGYTAAGTLSETIPNSGTAGQTVDAGNYVYGLDNTTWNGTSYVSGRAATENQLYYVGQSVKNLADQYQSDYNNITAVLGTGSFGLSDDNENETTTNLGSTVAVKGDGNITTAVQRGDLYVKLNSDINLGQTGSVTAGNTTIDSNGVNTNEVQVGNITITENGINGGTKQITDIASGLSGAEYETTVSGQENWNNAASIGDVYTIASNAASSASKVQSGKNITVGADNKVNLNDDITLGTDPSKQVKVDGTDGQVVIGSGDKAVILGQQSNTSGDSNPKEGNYLTGLDNTNWDASHIQSGRAATEDQLKAVDDKISGGRKFTGDDGNPVSVGLGDNLSLTGGADADNLTEGNIGVVKNGDSGLSVKLSNDLTGLNSVTAGNTTIDNNGLTIRTSDSSRSISIADSNVNMGNNIVSGVADGQVAQGSTDAVNGGQLWQRDQAINSLGGAVNKLGSRINRVGAGAAALAALHPLDFDPDEKWDFAAGYGNYKDASAMAVGAYYRPNEDTMFSIGGSFGGGENMVNAGISFKFGQGNHVSTSRVAMAKEIKDLRKEVESLRSALADVAAGNRLDPTKTKLFPDVASNHWAYNEIAQLHGNGIIEGYPDGTFKGDRMMTRYEFAMMVYREMQRGAQLSERIINEFEPELERIRVDVVAKDSEGNPTIERVRVIKGRK